MEVFSYQGIYRLGDDMDYYEEIKSLLDKARYNLNTDDYYGLINKVGDHIDNEIDMIDGESSDLINGNDEDEDYDDDDYDDDDDYTDYDSEYIIDDDED